MNKAFLGIIFSFALSTSLFAEEFFGEEDLLNSQVINHSWCEGQKVIGEFKGEIRLVRDCSLEKLLWRNSRCVEYYDKVRNLVIIQAGCR